MEEAGVSVSLADARSQHVDDDVQVDAVLDVTADGIEARFAVYEKRRAPYPNELPHLDARREALGRFGQPLLVAPFVAAPLAAALAGAGWSWADGEGNFGLRAAGLLLRQRRTANPPKPRRAGLPQGSGGLAIVRALIGFMEGEEEERSATALANQVGVTQPRASQVLGRLHALGLVHKTGRGRFAPDRAGLLDALLAQYSGPGGSEEYYYSLDSPTEVALAAAEADDARHTIVVSADVGPDLITPYRRPDVLIMYVREGVRFRVPGVVDARGREDANVIVRYPIDRSVFPTRPSEGELRGSNVPLADPTQMILDLEDLGGADRLEQAGMMRAWLLRLP